MVKCPHCNKPLSITLSGQFITNIDDSWYKTMEADYNNKMQHMPGILKSMSRALGDVKSMIKRDSLIPKPLEILSCSNCEKMLSMKFFAERKPPSN